MPQIRVVFERVYVRNDSDWWGSGEFYFIATVDGASVGRRDRIFPQVPRQTVRLKQ